MNDLPQKIAFPSAYMPLALAGNLRQTPADFNVSEVLGFTPSGDGEHHLVCIEKTGQNTQWVASELAKFAGIKSKSVGFCGRKDRHAVTTQWFSLHLPGQAEPLWQNLTIEGCTVKDTGRHNKKLRPGSHTANNFIIRLTALANTKAEPNPEENLLSQLEARLEQVKTQGVPNYFGYQRFGRNGQNLTQAKRWLLENKPPRRDQQGIILSSARAFIFNQVLAERVKQNNWHQMIEGDVAIDTLPTGPLWGRGRSATQGSALTLEQAALTPFSDWLNSLEHKGLTQERRSFCLKPEHFTYTITDFDTPQATLTLSFQLGTGAFATAVLNEILTTTDCSLENT